MPRVAAAAALALALAVVTTSPPGAAQTPPAPGASPRGAWVEPPRRFGHRDLVAEQSQMAPAPQPTPGLAAPTGALLLGASGGPTVKREVMGYLPYWSYTADAPYVPARWDLLTILAWFGVEMDGGGDITAYHGWGGATTAQIVADAHAHGVKVIVTVTNFSNSSIQSLVNSATNRAHAIETLLGVIATHGADGVNIDFEFVPVGARAGFVTFMTELKQAVVAAAPNGGPGHVSLAGPSVDWSGAYDYDVLLENTDGIMVMAYGYYWSGGNPGPTSPLFGGSPWSTYSVAWTIDDYLTWGGEENRHKVFIGLPWYGRTWPVPNTDVPTTALGSGATLVYRNAEAEVDGFGRMFDEHTRSTYYHKSPGGQLTQAWFDDYRSFRAKVAYIDEMDLGGLGIWALGYEGAYPDLWNAIDEVLGEGGVGPADPGPEPGPEPVPEPVPEPIAEPVAEPIADTWIAPDTAVAPDTSPGADTVSPQPDVSSPDDLVATPDAAPNVGSPRRDSNAASLVDGGGCAGGSGAAAAALLGLLGILVGTWLRRRSPTE
ncbi:MAG: hypothetical protein CVU56_02125 [Deltaproteobacteria bacterium HGW-Deltaproteobacteria-14]|jgi:spore germination protein YaaH|nr:MAG: hypothetical protein CVU56_02125 [Deltaproteobacteria bacterium HGW-Deltaproteobacteria-14]